MKEHEDYWHNCPLEDLMCPMLYDGFIFERCL